MTTIIGIIPTASAAEILLNNLAEVEFDLADVSVVMRDLKTRDALTTDAGPLKGIQPDSLIDRLSGLGLSQEKIQNCSDAVAQGKVLVALACSSPMHATIIEMLKDHSAQIIEE